ncbi:amidase family protein [Nocardia rhamnosiphila]
MYFGEPLVTSRQATALWAHDAHALAGVIADREVTAVEVVEAHLRRITDIDPILNATTAVLAETALATAAEVDGGAASRGPLAGVPFTVKNNLDVAGPTSVRGHRGIRPAGLHRGDDPAP